MLPSAQWCDIFCMKSAHSKVCRSFSRSGSWFPEREILLWSFTNIFSYAPRATLARCHLGLPGYRGGRHLWKGNFQSFPNHIRIIWIRKKKKSSTGRMTVPLKDLFLFNQTSIQSSVFFPQAEVLEAKRKKAENHCFLLLVVHLCTLHGSL